MQSSEYESIAPNSEPQKLFFESKSRYVAYGGARGGGKTHSAREKSCLMAFYYPGIKILVLRRTYAQLNKNFVEYMRPRLRGIAKYSDTKKSFAFPNGSKIDLGYCAGEKDVEQYQGVEYDVIFMDEATQFSETQFKKLDACIRGVNDHPKRFYLTCNPGGVGHAWVKRLFIIKKYDNGEDAEDYTFIPAKASDNKNLMNKDPGYIKRLQNLPQELRRAWLDGDWDVFIGQYFSEWRRDLHVIAPFVIPQHWQRYYTLDYGLDMLAGYGIAIDEDGFAVVYSELYEGKENGQGVNGGGLLISEAAKRIKDMTGGERIQNFYAPPDLWNRRQDTGRSVAEAFAEDKIYLTKVSNDRVHGWLALREWLKIKVTATGAEKPRIQIFENCVNLIESMPALTHDNKNPNDCAKEPHTYTHAPDALRYFVAGQPVATESAETRKEREEGQGAYFNKQIDDFLNFGL